MALKKIGALWPARSGNGYTGQIEYDKFYAAFPPSAGVNPRILLLKNKSDHPKAPEWDLLADDGEETHEGYAKPAASPRPAERAQTAARGGYDDLDDEIPF